MVNNLNINNYRPPHITQTDEPVWDDCTICSMYMGVIAATLGEVITKGPNWKVMTKAEIKTYREHIRKQTGKPKGGLSQKEVTVAMRKDWKWLPKIPQYDNGLREKWEDMMQGLLNGYCYVVAGNPIQVKNKNSAYRRWTNNDDFGHAVFYERARTKDGKRQIFLMDPLGRGSGFVGEWVPENQAKQFQWYDTKGYVKASKFKKGEWSIAGLAEKEKDAAVKEAAALRTTNATLVARANALETDIETEKVRAQNALTQLSVIQGELEQERRFADTLASELEECRNTPGGDCSSVINELKQATDRIAQLEADRDSLRNQLNQCLESSERQGGIIQAIIDFLTGKR